MKKLIFAWGLVTVLAAFVGLTQFKPLYGPDMLFLVLQRVPMDENPAVRYEQPQGYAHLTEGMDTSVDYRVQQFAMATVLVDVNEVDEFCVDLAERGYRGLAVSINRLVCIHPHLWESASAYSYYILAHELAHIALGGLGKEVGSHAWHHRPEHFELTLAILERLLEDNEVNPVKSFAILRTVELARATCAGLAAC